MNNNKVIRICLSSFVCMLLCACAFHDRDRIRTNPAIHRSYIVDAEYGEVVRNINKKITECKPFTYQNHETLMDPERKKAEIHFLSEYHTPILLVSIEALGDTSSQVEVFAVSDRSRCVAAVETVGLGIRGESGCP